MQGTLARFLGQPLLVRNFQPWARMHFSGMGCNHTHPCPPAFRAGMDDCATRRDWHLHEGLHWSMSAPHTHRFEVVSFSCAWNEC